jgi:hypothetical protein
VRVRECPISSAALGRGAVSGGRFRSTTSNQFRLAQKAGAAGQLGSPLHGLTRLAASLPRHVFHDKLAKDCIHLPTQTLPQWVGCTTKQGTPASTHPQPCTAVLRWKFPDTPGPP